MDKISGTVAHAVIMTAAQNKHSRESALLAMAWIAFTGGDYTTPLSQDFPEKFREACDRVAPDCFAITKETGALSDKEMVSTPLKLREENVEGFVMGMCESLGLQPEFAMSILGVIAYADGKLKKRIHLPTLSAYMSKEAARYGYEVEMQKPEDVPINITGAM